MKYNEIPPDHPCDQCELSVEGRSFASSDWSSGECKRILCVHCHLAHELDGFDQTATLTTILMKEACSRFDQSQKDYDNGIMPVFDYRIMIVKRHAEKIQNDIAFFGRTFWRGTDSIRGGFQKVVEESVTKTHKAKFGYLQFLSEAVDGRTEFHIDNHGRFRVILVTAKDDPAEVELKDIFAPAEVASSYIRSTIRAWNTYEFQPEEVKSNFTD